MTKIIDQPEVAESVSRFINDHKHGDISPMIKQIIHNFLRREKEIAKITIFFSKIYDKLYYDVLFKNIKIEKKTFRILENLASPTYSKTEEEWENILHKAQTTK
ncbi:MAG: hypothetical protein NTX91_03405 [candidate division SR1 bacterium]|nr:hypothetical protein [candidate division SR1 bacterium]